jgi:osmotically inducible protein OsmC
MRAPEALELAVPHPEVEHAPVQEDDRAPCAGLLAVELGPVASCHRAAHLKRRYLRTDDHEAEERAHMAMADRTASTVWEGDLAHGNGNLSLKSGATDDLPVTWASRTERSDGKTSPEELVAAAHASCFSMALSHELSEAGHEPERLDVSSTVTLDLVDGAPTVTGSKLTVRGRVPGIDEDEFEKAAQGAGKNCPISRALSIDIEVDAQLES